MKSFLIYSPTETARLANIAKLQQQLPNLQLVEAIYPDLQKVPFLREAMEVSAQRTGQALLPGEIGCLLSHRAVWQKILAMEGNDQEHILILESDSCLINPDFLQSLDRQVLENYDLFFWGAWDGHMQLFRSSTKALKNGYQVGEPFIKTIYCTYGYSINKTAAKLLLKRTNKYSYPVDQYKRFMLQKDLKIGGIKPELINTTGTASNIRIKNRWEFTNQLFLMLLDLKNYLICYFK